MSASTRLHISGLTPSISQQDIASKLASFGTVHAVDGFGALDGNGDPRKFAYATLEAQPSQVSKCINALSGTTWKGTRLRLAPAKPDFTARWEKEHAELQNGEPPKKRRKRIRGAQGRECNDMAPVTLDNYERHPGWVKTPLDHLVHPMRMRPGHPIPKPQPVEKTGEGKKKKKEKKNKKVKPVPTRATMRVLDPARWGATHLSGTLLESAVVSELAAKRDALGVEDESTDDDDDNDEATAPPAKATTTTVASSSSPSPLPQPPVKAPNADPLATSLREETSQSRKLLDALFGGADSDEWVAQDAIDSDLEELVQKHAPPLPSTSAQPSDEEDASSEDEDVDAMEEDAPQDEEAPPSPSPSEEQQPVQMRSLKAMFAPREEEAGFSLMAGLDLGDLELDDELSLLAPPPAPALTPAPALVAHAPTVSADEWRIAADAPGVRALFFPTSFNAHGFFRTETDEQIRARWEERKGALTADWKKRSREARKRGRRGAGVGGDE
ncbi:hypothetical protein EXIGLDRAFT_732325 [Exidia glandulosa HHB12029]|uniref:RRM domain-containing protein n=1 Tax=Exidia glandulosa HHB12029 TaxID=1314781 RepID=A0A165KRN7_EXIGL|nr:hypothetical protein EXIGLDRAFT_732325 [Exidia glandulosa HHB12029]